MADPQRSPSTGGAAAAAEGAAKKTKQRLLAFFGSSRFGWPWNIGLAESSSGGIEGPWLRLAKGNPLNIDGGKTENPIVIEVSVSAPEKTGVSSVSGESYGSSTMLLMLHDFVTDGARGFGMTWSRDGVNWANSTMVSVPGGCEAPMGILPVLDSAVSREEGGAQAFTVWWNKRGRYDDLFSAQFELSFV